MENKQKEERTRHSHEERSDFAALWNHPSMRRTLAKYPPEILWVNGLLSGTLGNFSASTGKSQEQRHSTFPPLLQLH